jgi:hypothetical protein
VYVAYSTLWVVGSLLAMQIRFIGFNHVVSNELLAWNGVFMGLQVGRRRLGGTGMWVCVGGGRGQGGASSSTSAASSPP